MKMRTVRNKDNGWPEQDEELIGRLNNITNRADISPVVATLAI